MKKKATIEFRINSKLFLIISIQKTLKINYNPADNFLSIIWLLKVGRMILADSLLPSAKTSHASEFRELFHFSIQWSKLHPKNLLELRPESDLSKKMLTASLVLQTRKKIKPGYKGKQKEKFDITPDPH